MTLVEPGVEERALGRRAAESRATVPVLELSVELAPDAELSTALLVAACASALREHPRANGAYRDGRFELYSRVNVGVIVADADRYLVPIVFDADTKSTTELKQEIESLAGAALAGQLSAGAFSGATFTLWHAGRLGVTSGAMPVVSPQAAAIVAGTRALTLCCDHRILYGESAAAFLRAVKSRLKSA